MRVGEGVLRGGVCTCCVRICQGGVFIVYVIIFTFVNQASQPGTGSILTQNSNSFVSIHSRILTFVMIESSHDHIN